MIDLEIKYIIPCYNEEHTIKHLFKELYSIKLPIDREYILVDDGSLKNHKELLDEDIIKHNLKVIRLKKNQGKGVVIRIGLKYASGDIFIIQDADFEYSPTDIPKLLIPIIENQTNVVYVTRFNIKPKSMSKIHYLANSFLTKLTNFFYNTNLTDMETGYKLFTKKVLDKITFTAREFEFEPEITTKIILSGFKIIELPIQYTYRKFGSAKINWLDGFESLLILIQQRFCPFSKLYQAIYDVYKFHVKKIINKLTKFLTKYIHMNPI